MLRRELNAVAFDYSMFDKYTKKYCCGGGDDKNEEQIFEEIISKEDVFQEVIKSYAKIENSKKTITNLLFNAKYKPRSIAAGTINEKILSQIYRSHNNSYKRIDAPKNIEMLTNIKDMKILNEDSNYLALMSEIRKKDKLLHFVEVIEKKIMERAVSIVDDEHYEQVEKVMLLETLIIEYLQYRSYLYHRLIYNKNELSYVFQKLCIVTKDITTTSVTDNDFIMNYYYVNEQSAQKCVIKSMNKEKNHEELYKELSEYNMNYEKILLQNIGDCSNGGVTEKNYNYNTQSENEKNLVDKKVTQESLLNNINICVSYSKVEDFVVTIINLLKKIQLNNNTLKKHLKIFSKLYLGGFWDQLDDCTYLEMSERYEIIALLFVQKITLLIEKSDGTETNIIDKIKKNLRSIQVQKNYLFDAWLLNEKINKNKNWGIKNIGKKELVQIKSITLSFK